MTDSTAPKILVVFFSRSGTTRKIANDIARRCGADVEELRDVVTRSGMWGYLRSAREAMRKVPANILPTVKDARNYDLVIIGTPVWAGHVSSPVRAYLTRSTPIKRTAFFCTMGGRGAEAVFAELAQLTKLAPLATVSLTAREVAQRRYDDRMSSFASAIALPALVVSSSSLEIVRLAGVH